MQAGRTLLAAQHTLVRMHATGAKADKLERQLTSALQGIDKLNEAVRLSKGRAEELENKVGADRCKQIRAGPRTAPIGNPNPHKHAPYLLSCGEWDMWCAARMPA